MPDRPEGFLPAGGNYRELLSYRKAEVIYDFTHRFCERFLKRGDRTIDQMVQAARSGEQNIAEGSKASKTSTEAELKLTNGARASLEELLLDYEDFLRTRGHLIWPKDSREALYVRRLGRKPDESFETYGPFSKTGRRRCWPTSPSVSSTRRTTSSTARSGPWRGTSSKKAASASG